MSLRDQIRQSRLHGVSMDFVPTPQSFDESEFDYDADADIRAGRFDRVEYAMAKAEQASVKADVSRESSNSTIVQPGPSEIAPTPTEAPEGAAV